MQEIKSRRKKKKQLHLINEFSKVAGYKTNFQKSVAFLYNNNEILKKEYFKIPFKIVPPKKIPRNKAEQGREDLYDAENCKTLIKEIKKD